ncbi:glycerate kinase [Clostridium cochlearium]|uniref:glycerate kinase n=1 Tax=Clostridium cochlearium TaxID=1494 RepID=UPI003C2DAE90
MPFGGGSLDKLHSIDLSNLNPRLSKVCINVACDVNNPLTGKNGASYVSVLKKVLLIKW